MYWFECCVVVIATLRTLISMLVACLSDSLFTDIDSIFINNSKMYATDMKSSISISEIILLNTIFNFIVLPFYMALRQAIRTYTLIPVGWPEAWFHWFWHSPNFSLLKTLDKLRTHVTRYYTQRNNYNPEPSIGHCTCDQHPISRPDRRAIGCLSWVIRWKMTPVYWKRIVLCKGTDKEMDRN